jgi:hypothetical protein
MIDPFARRKLLAMARRVVAATPEPLGSAELGAVLWLVDTTAYRELGQPVTGHPYVKHADGPIPRDMPELGELGNQEQVFIAASECALIDRVLALDPAARRDLAKSIGWQVAAIGEEIPYGTALLTTDGPTPAEANRAREVAQTIARDA